MTYYLPNILLPLLILEYLFFVFWFFFQVILCLSVICLITQTPFGLEAPEIQSTNKWDIKRNLLGYQESDCLPMELRQTQSVYVLCLLPFFLPLSSFLGNRHNWRFSMSMNIKVILERQSGSEDRSVRCWQFSVTSTSIFEETSSRLICVNYLRPTWVLTGTLTNSGKMFLILGCNLETIPQLTMLSS